MIRTFMRTSTFMRAGTRGEPRPLDHHEEATRGAKRRGARWSIALAVVLAVAVVAPAAYAWVPVNYWYGGFTGFGTNTVGLAQREYNQEALLYGQYGTTYMCVQYEGYSWYCSTTNFVAEGRTNSNVRAACNGSASQPNYSTCDTTKP